MKKLAVFVEGQTEQIFVERLLLEIAGKKNIHIDRYEATGRQGKRRFIRLEATNQSSGAKYYAQVIDSRGESNVKSDVRDRYQGLVSADFKFIIAIRDVLPSFTYAEISKLRKGLMMYVPTVPVSPLFVLGVMEIEAWFVSEHTHFERIHSELNPQLIMDKLGFDPRVDDIQLRLQPARDLNAIYDLVGLSYKKSRAMVGTTVNALSYEHCYLDLPNRLPDVKALVGAIDAFLT